MPHFAEINTQTNEVLRVLIAENKLWCENHLGGTWARTYYSTEGKNYAGVGYVYHPEQENFSPPQPYPSWTLDETLTWQAPVVQPDDENGYTWNEEELNWKITHVWVTNENGPLQVGDGIVHSNISGYFTKGEPALMTICDSCEFANSTTETYYSNIVSVTQSNMITTSETEQPGYTENVYWTSNTVSHYMGNVIAYYSNVVIYDGVNVYTNVQVGEYANLATDAQGGYTPVYTSNTSPVEIEGYEPVIVYSNVSSDVYDANVHTEYTNVITHYSNISVVETITYSNISEAEYTNLETEHVVTPGYTNFYNEASNTSIRVEQYAALTPDERAEYIVQTIEPVTTNLQSYYTLQTREVPTYVRELEGGIRVVYITCDHLLA
jgi:hypothetical protein